MAETILERPRVIVAFVRGPDFLDRLGNIRDRCISFFVERCDSTIELIQVPFPYELNWCPFGLRKANDNLCNFVESFLKENGSPVPGKIFAAIPEYGADSAGNRTTHVNFIFQGEHSLFQQGSIEVPVMDDQGPHRLDIHYMMTEFTIKAAGMISDRLGRKEANPPAHRQEELL